MEGVVVEGQSGLEPFHGAAHVVEPRELRQFWMVRRQDQVTMAAGGKRR